MSYQLVGSLVCLAQHSKLRSLDVKYAFNVNGITLKAFVARMFNSSILARYLHELTQGRVSPITTIVRKWLIGDYDVLDLTNPDQFRVFLLVLQYMDKVTIKIV